MEKYLLKKLFYFTLFNSYIIGLNASYNEEGWRERSNFLLSIDGQQHDLHEVHSRLSIMEEEITKRSGGKFRARNVALAEFSIIVNADDERQTKFGFLFFLVEKFGLAFQSFEGEYGLQELPKIIPFFLSGDLDSLPSVTMGLTTFKPFKKTSLSMENLQETVSRRLHRIDGSFLAQSRFHRDLEKTYEKIGNILEHISQDHTLSYSDLRESYLLREIQKRQDGFLKNKLQHFGASSSKSGTNVTEDIFKDLMHYADSEQYLMENLRNDTNIKTLVTAIRNVVGHARIAACILHLHTRFFPCHICASSIFRESELEDGFPNKVISAIGEQQHMFLPHFILMTSYREPYEPRGSFSSFDGKDIASSSEEAIRIERFFPFFPTIKISIDERLKKKFIDDLINKPLLKKNIGLIREEHQYLEGVSELIKEEIDGFAGLPFIEALYFWEEIKKKFGGHKKSLEKIKKIYNEVKKLDSLKLETDKWEDSFSKLFKEFDDFSERLGNLTLLREDAIAASCIYMNLLENHKRSFLELIGLLPDSPHNQQENPSVPLIPFSGGRIHIPTPDDMLTYHRASRVNNTPRELDL